MSEQRSPAGDGAPPTEAQPSGDGHYSELAEISRAMVAVYKDLFGRGPVKARTSWAGEDTLICVLEESLTLAEKNLRDLDEHQRLRDMRVFFQYSALEDFVEPIERITGRTVRSFISGVDTVEDTSVETFILYPRGSEGASRRERGGA